MVNEKKLDELIETTIEEMASMDVGSDEDKTSSATLAQLMDRSIEMKRIEQDAKDKEAVRIDERKDRLVKNILTGAGIVLPIALTIWGTKASFKFEEAGTITTIMGRGFINRLMGKK